MAIEHGGGGIPSEWSEGVAHPLTDPFKTLSQKEPECYSMDEMSMALNRVIGWVCNEGHFQRRGVFNRAMTLGFLMQSPELNLKTQTDLANKLNLSRSQTNAIVRDFTDKFDFGTTTQRVRRGAKNNLCARNSAAIPAMFGQNKIGGSYLGLKSLAGDRVHFQASR